MTLAEVASVAGPLVTVGVMLITAIYVRGKLDGTAAITANRIDRIDVGHEDEARFQGAQEVRNGIIERLENDVRRTDEKASEARTGLDFHLRECARVGLENGKRFDKIDATLANMAAQINNIAMGRTGKLYEVKPEEHPP